MTLRALFRVSMYLWLGAGVVRADAPLGRYTISADTVRDNRTGLTWQRSVSAGTQTQAQGSTYCSALPLSGGDWRLPTIVELQSLVDVTRFNPSIDPAAFPNTPASLFWSSSVDVGQSGNSWVVNFGEGRTHDASASTTASIRCVR